MAQAIVTDIYWRFNPATCQVDIIADGTILETTDLAHAAARVTFHRNEAAKASPVACVESSPYRKHNRGAR